MYYFLSNIFIEILSAYSERHPYKLYTDLSIFIQTWNYYMTLEMFQNTILNCFHHHKGNPLPFVGHWTVSQLYNQREQNIPSLWICLYWAFHTNRTIQYVPFGVWFPSCSIMFSKSIHVVSCVSTLVDLRPSNISLCEYNACCLSSSHVMYIWVVLTWIMMPWTFVDFFFYVCVF